MHKFRLVSIAVFVLFTATLGFSAPDARGAPQVEYQNDGQLYVPETGHWITGEFLAVYQAVADPARIYGYPITDAYHNPTTGRLVQFFEKAHFELRPEFAREIRVHRTLLGEYLYEPGQSLTIAPNTPGCRTIQEGGRQVCYAFLTFFEDNGGVPQFGYPISDIEIHNERIVQYFQRARFEWRPELPSGKRVVLTDLGRQYFESRKEEPVRLLPSKDRFIPAIILDLKVRAFPHQAVISPGDEQTLYVIVLDQNLRPVPKATVFFTVRYPSGREMEYLINGGTNEYGVATLSFHQENETTVGLVEITATASYDNLKEKTVASFRIWW